MIYMERKEYNIAVVGASGLVGRKMVQVLQERNFPVKKLHLFASSKSAGTKIKFRNEEIEIQELTSNSFDGIDIALFSAGGSVSKEFAPIAAKHNCTVIDNSSAWRMDDNVPLVVPEVNAHALEGHQGIIANPNCSTIQLVAVLSPIHKFYGLKRVVVSTYQSISGAGQKGVDQLMGEIKSGQPSGQHPIAFSTAFHPFEGNEGFTNEEIKMINEPRKIMELPNLKIAVTCVRLPILGGHGESVNIETEKEIEIPWLINILGRVPGLMVLDSPQGNFYPTPAISNDTDEVYIGHIRKDDSVENGAYLWIVADNLRKGAATNAVQIAEKLIGF